MKKSVATGILVLLFILEMSSIIFIDCTTRIRLCLCILVILGSTAITLAIWIIIDSLRIYIRHEMDNFEGWSQNYHDNMLKQASTLSAQIPNPHSYRGP